MKKKIIATALILAAMFSFTACGAASQQPVDADEEAPAPVETESVEVKDDAAEELPAPESSDGEATEAETEPSRVMVVYFSRTGEQYNVGVIDKGNTAIVAEMIAAQTGADVYEILPADDHYPMTYDELTDIALEEQKDGARPAIAGELPDLDGYDTIFIGAPVWWGDWPMILYTFFESMPLEGKTLIPFSTHAGSGLSGFNRSLAAAYPDCTVGEGLAIVGADAQNDPDKVQASVSAWLDGLGF